MSYMSTVKCDICHREGDASQGGWVRLTNFAYVKHACPECVKDTDNYGGSDLRDERLRQQILDRG